MYVSCLGIQLLCVLHANVCAHALVLLRNVTTQTVKVKTKIVPLV